MLQRATQFSRRPEKQLASCSFGDIYVKLNFSTATRLFFFGFCFFSPFSGRERIQSPVESDKRRRRRREPRRMELYLAERLTYLNNGTMSN